MLVFNVLSDHICISALDLNITNSKLFDYASHWSSNFFAMHPSKVAQLVRANIGKCDPSKRHLCGGGCCTWSTL